MHSISSNQLVVISAVLAVIGIFLVIVGFPVLGIALISPIVIGGFFLVFFIIPRLIISNKKAALKVAGLERYLAELQDRIKRGELSRDDAILSLKEYVSRNHIGQALLERAMNAIASTARSGG